MRTTLDIDDDVLRAAEKIAAARKQTAGAVISELVRTALAQPDAEEPAKFRGGFRLLAAARDAVTDELVEKQLEDG